MKSNNKKHIEKLKWQQDRQSKHLICNHCDENAKLAKNLTRYKNNKHEKPFEYTCDHCGV